MTNTTSSGIANGAGAFGHEDYISASVMYAQMIERFIAAQGLTPTQYRMLVRLAASSGGVRIGQLAEALGIGPSGVTAAVGQLERRGLVTRKDSASDHRQVDVALTVGGMRHALALDERIRPTMEDIRNDFPSPYRKYASLCTLRVADSNQLFGEGPLPRNVNTALCDEILMTPMLVNAAAKCSGLNITEYRLLLQLKDFHTGLQPGAISRRLGIKPNTLAAVQSSLLKKRLIRRSRKMRDRRAVLVELSPGGYRALRDCSYVVQDALHTQLLPDLGPDDIAKHRELAQEVLRLRSADGNLRLYSQSELRR